MACKHAIPKTGLDGYKGFEFCPYCGDIAKMFTKFHPVDKEDFEKDRRRDIN